MTARSVSWTDPARIAALLSQVSAERPGSAPAMRSLLPAPGARLKASAPVKQAVSAPVKQAASAPAKQAASAPEEVAPPAAPAVPEAPKGSVPAPAPVRRAPPKLTHTSENPADRIDMLLFWTLDNYRCSGAFLADENGLTLGAHGITEAHVAIVGPLFASLAGIRSVPGIDASSGALWLGAQMMSWVEARSEHGAFCLGTVGEEALLPRDLSELKEALAETIRGL